MKPIVRGRVADQAYAAIREQILTREMLPGQRLSVPRLADELAVSRSPIREAVQRLVAEGLATERANHGAVVAFPDLTALAEMYEVRAPLDGLAAELMTARATPEDVAALTVALSTHREAFTSGDVAALIQADVAFHEGIARASGNRELVGVLQPIYRRVVLGMLGGELSRWPAQAVEEHQAIVDAIAAGAGAQARSAAEAHVHKVRDRLLDKAAALEAPADVS